MDYISNTDKEREEMAKAIGIQSIEDLFEDIPKKLLLKERGLDDGLSELEAKVWMQKLADKNSYPSFDSYLGAGSYDHFIPSFVRAICQKSEFLTSYTPYQAEASQGMLQALFEFQSSITALTGLDAANASVYDGATAAGESALMALRVKKPRDTLIVFESIHPLVQAVICQYVLSQGFKIKTIPCDNMGKCDLETFRKEINETIAGVIIQSPNFFGRLEDAKGIFEEAKRFESLAIHLSNPIAYGLFSSAKEVGADIAAGEMQPLGIPPQFGGPYAGYMACTQDLIRQMPARIVGETVDSEGKRGFILTLQAREQHIRREKATSNICTSQSLSALASLLTLLWYGKEGLKRLAETNFKKANYLKNQLSHISGLTLPTEGVYFNEFPVLFPIEDKKVFEHFKAEKIIPGASISSLYKGTKKGWLVNVTEKKNLTHLENYLLKAKNLFK